MGPHLTLTQAVTIANSRFIIESDTESSNLPKVTQLQTGMFKHQVNVFK